MSFLFLFFEIIVRPSESVTSRESWGPMSDFTILNSSGRFIVNGSGKYLQVDATGFSVATDSSTDQRGYLLTDNLTGQQILQYPDASGTLVLLENDNAFTGKNTFNNSSGDFKPYFIGVYTGLSYKF